MENSQPIALSIGGWDPCGGAGLAADIKTFEGSGVLGMGVCTALTCQVHDVFDGLEWTDPDWIYRQLKLLIGRYKIGAVKFGIVPSLPVLNQCIRLIKATHPEAMIIWDPILKASAGFEFHAGIDRAELLSVLDAVRLVTPNRQEAELLFGTSNPEAIRALPKVESALLLKGGHANGHANDVLIEGDRLRVIAGERFAGNPGKHGSGCVLSAAICAELAKGNDLHEACVKGKRYVERFIRSSNHLLGSHFDN